MMLSPGTQLGPYTIISALGAGGMGEVYRAKDTRLDRTVAAKILLAEVVQDPERLRRFIQEAKAASALNHPNVAHIYEIGEFDGIHFLTMEYVVGTTLDSCIKKDSLEIEKIIELAIQIGDAL